MASVDCGVRAHVMTTTKLLEQFNEENIRHFKQCLLDELQITNEAQFLCSVLNLMYKSMNYQSVLNLRNKAMEIAATQKVIKQDVTGCSCSEQCVEELTVLDAMKTSYKDPLSQLPSDVIDLVGNFLNKKESTELGYLNKRLYIESQKDSYLLTRCTDKSGEILNLEEGLLDCLCWMQSNPVSYQYPTSLKFSELSDFHEPILQSLWFRKLLTRINELRVDCARGSCKKLLLNKIAFDLLANYNKHIHSSQSIELIDISLPIFCPLKGLAEELQVLYSKLEDIECSQSCSENELFRRVNKLSLSARRACGIMTDEEKSKAQSLTSSMQASVIAHLSMFKFRHLDITGYRAAALIQDIEQLKRIFHSDLERIEMGLESIDCSNIYLDAQENILEPNTKLVNITLDCKVYTYFDRRQLTDIDLQKLFEVFDVLDRLKYRRHITSYHLKLDSTISLRALANNATEYEIVLNGELVRLLNKILIQDDDKHPMLNALLIEFVASECVMLLFAFLLKYMANRRDRILIRLRKIQFVFSGLWYIDTAAGYVAQNNDPIMSYQASAKILRNHGSFIAMIVT